jgi:hypothetical protein
MEQTAVELLIEQIKSKADSLPYNTKENRIAKGIYVDCLMMAKQAKEMEKEQIIDANIAGQMFIAACPGHYKNDAEDYYNETFKQD